VGLLVGVVVGAPLLAECRVDTFPQQALVFALVRILRRQGLDHLARLRAELEVHNCVRRHTLDHRPSFRADLELNCKEIHRLRLSLFAFDRRLCLTRSPSTEPFGEYRIVSSVPSQPDAEHAKGPLR
jgi:hypothetical protein